MIKIRSIFIALLLATFQLVNGQGKLQVQGTSPDLHLVHTVAAKENWYSIGRIYNQSPKEIAPFNGTTLDKPLAIGQKIKIPLTDANFSQDGTRASDELFVPVYHTVQDKEWMFRISTSHNKVPVENLEAWNGVKNDQLRSGMQLIVGYLKVKQAQSSLASSGVSKISMATGGTLAVKETKPEEKKEVKTVPVVAREEPRKTEPPREEVVKNEPPKEENKTNETPTVTPAPPSSHKGGAFRKLYAESGNGTAGNAGIFRSTSGWNDGKYYALMNNVPVGTIVKVSFSSTNKSVYAKVLGQLPEMRESQGLTLRISDAAASELGVSLNKFYVDVKY